MEFNLARAFSKRHEGRVKVGISALDGENSRRWRGNFRVGEG